MGKAGTPALTKTAITDRWASGVAGVTRRGSQTEQHGRPLWMPEIIGTTGGYK